ncbi:FAD-binding oxidoreductase [Actinoplanes sp. URMC 104]|uniref:FAD-binding oxidoreductase n=1 Tax=Actinoplanes sp. URMC 104 TaxID=3423409 RepID=UPI003F1C368C
MTTTAHRPAGAGEAAQLLRESHGTVLFRGAGTKMRWAGRTAEPDLVVESGGMRRLLAHNPADMTAVVEAGMPLSDLQDALASSGQWLALDPPTQAAGATVGGLLTTGDSGPRRLRYGAMRDLVIGVTLVLADGTVAHAGGQVIKNVAGYDLTKLTYGSLGTLAMVAEVVVRLHPRPEDSASVLVPASAPAAAAITLRLTASPLEPSAVDWSGDPGDGDGRLAVRFEGSAAGVRAQTAALRALVPEADGAQTLTGDDEAALWRDLAAAAPPEHSVAFAGTLPSRLPEVAAALRDAAQAAQVPVRLRSHTALGLHSAHFGGSAPQQIAAFESWRGAVLALGGTVLLRDRPPEVDAVVDALGPAPSAVALLRALKSRLDPRSRLAPGRLQPWL